MLEPWEGQRTEYEEIQKLFNDQAIDIEARLKSDNSGLEAGIWRENLADGNVIWHSGACWFSVYFSRSKTRSWPCFLLWFTNTTVEWSVQILVVVQCCLRKPLSVKMEVSRRTRICSPSMAIQSVMGWSMMLFFDDVRTFCFFNGGAVSSISSLSLELLLEVVSQRIQIQFSYY